MEPVKIVNTGHPITTNVLWHGQQTDRVLSVDLTGEGQAKGSVVATLQVVAEIDVYASYVLLDVLEAWNALADVWPQAGHAPSEKVRPAWVHVVAPTVAVLVGLQQPNGRFFQWIAATAVHMEHNEVRVALRFPPVEVAWPTHAKQDYADELRLLLKGMRYEGITPG